MCVCVRACVRACGWVGGWVWVWVWVGVCVCLIVKMKKDPMSARAAGLTWKQLLMRVVGDGVYWREKGASGSNKFSSIVDKLHLPAIHHWKG